MSNERTPSRSPKRNLYGVLLVMLGCFCVGGAAGSVWTLPVPAAIGVGAFGIAAFLIGNKVNPDIGGSFDPFAPPMEGER